MSLESALALERGGIVRLFETADAREGLIRKAPNIPGAPEEARPGQASASNPQ